MAAPLALLHKPVTILAPNAIKCTQMRLIWFGCTRFQSEFLDAVDALSPLTKHQWDVRAVGMSKDLALRVPSCHSKRMGMRISRWVCAGVLAFPALAAAAISPIMVPVTMSEAVNVVTTSGTPRIALDVGGNTRYATYSSGSGTASLSFSYAPTLGDVDLDGITITPASIDLNGGTIKDLAGNDISTLTFSAPNTSAVKVNYPSLSMDFIADADGRYTLNGTAYDDLAAFLAAAGGSFSRSSIGTYYDSAGTLQTASSGTPRFDYDPVTHAAKGILIEESRTNRTRYSQDFINSQWTGSGSFITSNTVTAPDGTLTADTLTQASNATDFIYDQNISASPNTAYSFSIFFKPGTRTTDFSFMLDWADFGSQRVQVTYTYATQTLSTGGSGVARISSTTIQTLPNGWYRMSLVFTTDTTVGHIVSMIGRFGSGTGTTHIWGAQLEQGAFATSYIPTTSATVTRAADVLTIPTGSWFNGLNGTQYVHQYYTSGRGDYSPIIGSAQNNSIGISYQGSFGNAVVSFVDGLYNASSGALSSSSFNKMALAHSASQTSISRNGSSPSNGVGKTIPTATTFYLGRDFNGTQAAEKWVKTFKYYPLRASDTQLQLLTQ